MDQGTEHVLLAAIVAVPPTLAALASLLSSWRNRQAIRQLSKDVDGRLSELLAMERREGYYEGLSDGLRQGAQGPPAPPAGPRPPAPPSGTEGGA